MNISIKSSSGKNKLNMLKITINFCGKSTLDVEPLDQIATVKQKICNQKGIKPANQRLVFAGTELEDAKTITDYGIENNSRIDLVPLYPKCEVSKNDQQPVQDFVVFHSNCEGWMMESFIANGSLIEERDKWKEVSYKVTSGAVQSKKQNILLITELEELKKCCRDLMQKAEKTVEENAKYRDESAKFRDENAKFRDENTRLADENAKFRDESAKYRDESAKFRDENAKFRDENTRLADENAKFRDESAKFRDESAKYRDENARLKEKLEKSVEEVKATLMDHLNKCEPTIDKLAKLLLKKN